MKTDVRPREVFGVLPSEAMPLGVQGTPAYACAGLNIQSGAAVESFLTPLRPEAMERHVPASASQGLLVTDPEAQTSTLQDAVNTPEQSRRAVLVLDSRRGMVMMSDAVLEMCGYDPSQLLGEQLHVLSSGRTQAKVIQNMWDSIELQGQWSGEVWLRRVDGSEMLARLAVSSMHDGSGEVCSYVATLLEGSKYQDFGEPSMHSTLLDTFTPMTSRVRFLHQLGKDIEQSQRTGTSVALLLVDIDHFQEINHALGYEEGDRILASVVQRLHTVNRDRGLVAQLGDDEFALTVGGIQESQCAKKVAQEIMNVLSDSFEMTSGAISVTASIGIALFPGDSKNAECLLTSASKALHSAKGSGRNCYRFFTPDLELNIQNRLWLAHELRSALSHQQFWLAYQPIVSLKTGKVRKAEALIRWQHPERGLISPAEFIPVAESSGMIVEIGEWVFRTAAAQAARMRREYSADFQVSVNKSPAQFHRQSETSETWIQYLTSCDLSCQSIVVEITEGLLLEDSQRVDDQLRSLREAGLQLSLDDFGTGYSSLAYLQKHDIDYVKIDQSFVRNLVADSKEMTLCEAIITIAHKLNMEVVAEGIETFEQLQLLRNAGCDFGQGYFLARPLSAPALEAFMAESGNSGNPALKG